VLLVDGGAALLGTLTHVAAVRLVIL